MSFTISDIYGKSPIVKLDGDITPYIEVNVSELTKDMREYTGLPNEDVSMLTATEYSLDLDEGDGGHKEWQGEDIDTNLGIVNLTIEPSSSLVYDSTQPHLADGVPESVTIRFRLRVGISNVSLAYVSPKGSSRHVFGGYYSTETDIYQVLEITDFNFNHVGQSDYGFMDFISNLDKIWDLRGESEGKYVGMMNKEVSPFYIGAYVTGLANHAGRCDLRTGYKYVSDCRILEPTQAPEKDGDIYNRHFIVQESIYAKPKEVDASMLDNKVKYDDSISKKTICDNPNKEEYKKLLDSYVPTDLHSKMENLLKEQLKLGDSHFNVALT